MSEQAALTRCLLHVCVNAACLSICNFLTHKRTIIGEHEFRVKHCLLAKPGVKREQIKYAISHPQALAQCDNFLRGLGITPIATYDTAGSAKMISEGLELPDRCTPENTAAIASDLAGNIYKLNCLNKGIEDDDTNFTRFLLLSRKDVVQYLNKKIPSKTSVVFALPDSPGKTACVVADVFFLLRTNYSTKRLCNQHARCFVQGSCLFFFARY